MAFVPFYVFMHLPCFTFLFFMLSWQQPAELAFLLGLWQQQTELAFLLISKAVLALPLPSAHGTAKNRKPPNEDPTFQTQAKLQT